MTLTVVLFSISSPTGVRHLSAEHANPGRGHQRKKSSYGVLKLRNQCRRALWETRGIFLPTGITQQLHQLPKQSWWQTWCVDVNFYIFVGLSRGQIWCDRKLWKERARFWSLVVGYACAWGSCIQPPQILQKKNVFSSIHAEELVLCGADVR